MKWGGDKACHPSHWAGFCATARLLFLSAVRNVFNKQPEQPDPWASTGGTTSIGSFGGWLQGDDPLGRYYTLGFRYKL